jgi:hypothetical protein
MAERVAGTDILRGMSTASRLQHLLLSPALGWALAAAALAVGYLSHGWPGLWLALSAVAFWLLLQFSRSLRVLRMAAQRPKGSIANAVMLQARLQPGMPMLQVLPLTRSLGERVAEEPETWLWRDASGDAVRVELRAGRVSAVRLERATAGEQAQRGEPGQ